MIAAQVFFCGFLSSHLLAVVSMGKTLPDVDELTDDEDMPRQVRPKGKGKDGKGRGKMSAAKTKAAAKPKPAAAPCAPSPSKPAPSPSKPADSSSSSLKRPAASSLSTTPLKKPAAAKAAAKPVMKKPSAETGTKATATVCKYKYKSNGVWGFKIGGREKMRAPCLHQTSCRFCALVYLVQCVNLQSSSSGLLITH